MSGAAVIEGFDCGSDKPCVNLWVLNSQAVAKK